MKVDPARLSSVMTTELVATLCEHAAGNYRTLMLANRSIEDGALADDLGKHVVQRLTGKPAPSLVP